MPALLTLLEADAADIPTPPSGKVAFFLDSGTGLPSFKDSAGSVTAVTSADPELAAIAGLTSAANKGIQFTGSGTAATFDLTTAGKALLDDADAAAQRATLGIVIPYPVAVSDETTALTTGAAKATFRIPFACTMTAIPRANVNTVSSSGAPEFDVKKNGTTIFSTNLTIDASEKTSVTAATPAALSGGSTSFADDDEVTIDIVAAGTGTKGAKLTFYLIPT